MRDDAGRTKGNQAQSDRADARAASLAPILTRLRAGGVTSSGALAAALTARNIPTLSGRGLGRLPGCITSSGASHVSKRAPPCPRLPAAARPRGCPSCSGRASVTEFPCPATSHNWCRDHGGQGD